MMSLAAILSSAHYLLFNVLQTFSHLSGFGATGYGEGGGACGEKPHPPSYIISAFKIEDKKFRWVLIGRGISFIPGGREGVMVVGPAAFMAASFRTGSMEMYENNDRANETHQVYTYH